MYIWYKSLKLPDKPAGSSLLYCNKTTNWEKYYKHRDGTKRSARKFFFFFFFKGETWIPLRCFMLLVTES